MWRVSRFLEICLCVALWCASAKRSHLLPEVFDDFSSVRRGLFPGERATIREVNGTVVALNFFETGGTVDSEPREKVGYSMWSTDLASLALRRLHFVISDFRPASFTESGEAALRRVLASRAIGGDSLTSDDPAPGSPTVFQIIASCSTTCLQCSYLGSLLSSSARSHLDARMLRPVFEVADMVWEGFVRNLVEAGSVDFVQDAVEHVGRFIIDARASNRHVLRSPAGPMLAGEGLCHMEFHGAPEDAQNWFVVLADIKNAFHQMLIPGWLQAFLCNVC